MILAAATAAQWIQIGAADLRIIWLVALGLLAIAGLLRRVLPLGVESGVMLAALSAALLTTYAKAPLAGDRDFDVSPGCAALAVMWYIAVRWIERAPATVSRGGRHTRIQPMNRHTFRRSSGLHAAALLGLTAVGLLVDRTYRPETLGIFAVLLTLITAEIIWSLRADRNDRLPLLFASFAGLSAVLLYAATDGWRRRAAFEDRAAIVICICAGLAIVLVLFPVLNHWRYRRRVWLSSPDKLRQPFVPRAALQFVTLGLCAAVGVIVLAWPTVGFRIPALIIATFAALGVAHHPTHLAALASHVGCALLALTGYTTWVAIFPGGQLATLAALQFAAILLLVELRIWRSQRSGDVVLTTSATLVRPADLVLASIGAVAWLIALRGDDGSEAPSAYLSVAILIGGLIVARGMRERARDSRSGALLVASTLVAGVSAYVCYARIGGAQASVTSSLPAVALLVSIWFEWRQRSPRFIRMLAGAIIAVLVSLIALICALFLIVRPSSPQLVSPLLAGLVFPIPGLLWHALNMHHRRPPRIADAKTARTALGSV